MKVFRSLSEVQKENKDLIAILGNFDGVHKGHVSLIDTAKEIKGSGDSIIVVAFDPHPKDYFGKGVKKLYTLDEKLAAFERIGIDLVLLLPFAEVAGLSPEDFVKDYLVDGLGVKKVVIGYNYRFGKMARGDSNNMVSFGKMFGFDAVIVPEFMENGVNVSSSVIRGLLEDHDIAKANELLGYKFSLKGKVIHGKGLGKTLGFPTANLEINDNKIWPGLGVYCVYGYVRGGCYYGICNVGFQPTIEGGYKSMVVEVNFFDFDYDIYDEMVEIYFLDYLREITKFDSKEILIDQIREDKARSLDIIKVLCN